MKIIASVDRFEGDWAILLDGKTKIELPRAYLPKSVKAGGWVNITIEENIEKRVQVQENVQNLLDELKAGEHLK